MSGPFATRDIGRDDVKVGDGIWLEDEETPGELGSFYSLIDVTEDDRGRSIAVLEGESGHDRWGGRVDADVIELSFPIRGLAQS